MLTNGDGHKSVSNKCRSFSHARALHLSLCTRFFKKCTDSPYCPLTATVSRTYHRLIEANCFQKATIQNGEPQSDHYACMRFSIAVVHDSRLIKTVGGVPKNMHGPFQRN